MAKANSCSSRVMTNIAAKGLLRPFSAARNADSLTASASFFS